MRAALTLLFLLFLAPAANAASVAYIADGEVWLASLDGSQRVKLAGRVTNTNGALEKWNAVAQADNGRILASRNEPGKISSLSWFQVWEPNGTSTIQGPLNKTGSYQLPTYPLGLDVTADGKFMVYGYSNSNCCPYTLATGTYVRPVSNSVLEPISISGQEDPSLFGSRVIAHSGTTINVQNADATTFGSQFTGWVDAAGTGLELRRTDIAANGRMAALELEQWTTGTQTTGKIALITVQGVDQSPTFPAAVDCFVPSNGVATDVSLSQDATRVAWSDADGLKVAGTPTTAADPCVLSAPPVVIAPKGAVSASIGPANVSAFLPPAPPPPSGGGGPSGGTPPAGPGAGTTAPDGGTPSQVKLTFTLTFSFKAATKTSTKLSSLVLRGLPAGATVVVGCKGKGCPKGLTKKNVSGTLNLKALIKKPLRAGAVLKVTVTKAGAASATKTLTIRKKKAPLLKTL